jgi:hypothetical protein
MDPSSKRKQPVPSAQRQSEFAHPNRPASHEYNDDLQRTRVVGSPPVTSNSVKSDSPPNCCQLQLVRETCTGSSLTRESNGHDSAVRRLLFSCGRCRAKIPNINSGQSNPAKRLGDRLSLVRFGAPAIGRVSNGGNRGAIAHFNVLPPAWLHVKPLTRCV